MSASAPTLSGAPQHIPEVDGLRALAVTAVILFHFKNILPGGWIGVDLFFVISGFVITRSLLAEYGRTGSNSLRRFFLRRVRRILPAVVVLIAVALPLTRFCSEPQEDQILTALAAITSTYNWFLAFEHPRTSPLVHLWSLSVEEQFYFAWPLLFAFLTRAKRRLGLISLSILIAASAVWTLLLGWLEAPWQRIYFASDTRVQGIALGCLLAMLGAGILPRTWVRIWPLPVIIFALMALTLDNHSPALGLGVLSLVAFISAWLVAIAAESADSRFAFILRSKVLQWMGTRSYGLFLWHFPAAHFLHHLASHHWVFLASVTTPALAELSYRYVERPFLEPRPCSGA